MGRSSKNLVGGLLSGLGQGMMAQDKNRLDNAVKQREAVIAALRAERAARGEDRAIRKESRDIWAQTIKDFTTKTAGLNGATEVVDWGAAAKDFESSGHTDLAERARSRISTEIDKDSDKYLEAELKAEKWIKKTAGLLTSDAEDFKEYGGDRDVAKEAKIREFLGMPATSTTQPAKPTNGGGSGGYNTAEDVGLAYQNGELSLQEAEKILKEKFGKT